jgi:hypothetical protein
MFTTKKQPQKKSNSGVLHLYRIIFLETTKKYDWKKLRLISNYKRDKKVMFFLKRKSVKHHSKWKDPP